MALQEYDVFSRCHPAVNFLFFAAAIVLTVVLFHPAYLLVSLVCGGAYYAALRRSRCGKTLGFLLLVLVLVAAVNPIFNTPFYLQRSIEVNYSSFTAEWQIKGKSGNTCAITFASNAL